MDWTKIIEDIKRVRNEQNLTDGEAMQVYVQELPEEELNNLFVAMSSRSTKQERILSMLPQWVSLY